MNRLVLIGNGFDIAHGLKTRYENFIDWYWEEWGKRLLTGDHNVESDELCSFTLRPSEYYYTWYQFWVGPYMQKPNPFAPWNPNDVVRIAKEADKISLFKYTTPFFEKINKSIETKRWVDIEQEYYYQLINAQKNSATYYLTLNKQLDFLRKKLLEYLEIEGGKECNLIDEIRDKIYCPIERPEIAVGFSLAIPLDELTPKNIMLLNFNYTNTPEMYLAENSTVNYIHGKLDAPQSVIFGYGDELDVNYKKLKEQNDSECMRHVKSILYLEHDNYRRMLEFIESAPFQVVIMGHSCGNSDRTLLNTIFEHRNCLSIKPYYYKRLDGSDNYSELTISINRNFTDPKSMRNKVVYKEKCEPLTGDKGQAELKK